MLIKRQSLCPSRWQRRRTFHNVQAILAQAEDFLTVGIVFVVFLFPLLLNPSFLFDVSAYLWWIKGFAWLGLLAWVGLRLLLWLPLVPAQLTGATVEAMGQTSPEKELVPLPAPLETECPLLAHRQTPLLAGRQIEAQTRAYRRTWQRRRQHRLLPDLLVRRLLPSSSHKPITEPSI